MTHTESQIVTSSLSVQTKAASYDILIGDKLLDKAGAFIQGRLGARRCLIVTDINVGSLYQQRLETALTIAGHTLLPTCTIPAGEGSKNFTTLQAVLDHMLDKGVDRKTLIVALGGGVVGDMAGFAASIVLRGVDFVQIPTTLLAQVDSSVGGKTGIDTRQGKNMVGAFYQPRLVIADVSLLDTLPERERESGYAELVKYGLIKDPAFFRWCQAHGKEVLTGNRSAQIHAVSVSCQHKAQIVAADEREAGERALLNLGHTFGHALETATGYALLAHGEAVSIGMVMAFQLSAKLGLCSEAEAEEVRAHLLALGLPVTPPHHTYDLDQLMRLMGQDKKAEAGRLTLILAHGIGQAFVSRHVSEKDVRSVWETFLLA